MLNSKTQFRVPKFNFIDELLEYASRRTGEDMEFTKKGILSLLEHEICTNKCNHLMTKLAHMDNTFKISSHTKNSVLHYLCHIGDMETVRELLKRKVSFNILNYEGMNPSFIAILQDHMDVAQELSIHGFRPVGPKKYIIKLYEE